MRAHQPNNQGPESRLLILKLLRAQAPFSTTYSMMRFVVGINLYVKLLMIRQKRGSGTFGRLYADDQPAS